MEAAGHHSQAARINRAISEAGFDIDALLSPEPASRPRTDLGNAERLIDQYGADLRYCPPLGGWFVWDGRRWRKDDAKQVYRLAYETVRGIYAEAALLTDRQEREDMSRWAVQSEAKHRSVEAQEEMHHVHQSINQFVSKTLELGRMPTEADFQDGEGCGHGGCGCGHSH